ncbi:MAG: glycosyltransferase [Bacteroidota bacterium]
MFQIKESITSTNNGKFSIIIPSWNNLDYLKLCISSLRKNSFFDNQIIIAVNEGADGTVGWLETQKNIDFIYSKENLGVCYAVNACRPHVNNDYIVYMNDDMYACPNWDKYLFDEIETLGTDYFYLSATLIEPIKNNNPSSVAIIKDYGNSVENFNEQGLLANCDNLSINNWRGASWPPNVVHKKVWDLVGGYSIEFSPGMYSDPDFSMKLYKTGVRIFFGVGKSLVYHFGEKSTGRVKKNKGSKTFLLKWKMTARTFYSEYLQIGKEYHKEYPLSFELPFWSKVRNEFKRIFKSLN